MAGSFLKQAKPPSPGFQMFPWLNPQSAGVYGATGGLMAPVAPAPTANPFNDEQAAYAALKGFTAEPTFDAASPGASFDNTQTPVPKDVGGQYLDYAGQNPGAPANGTIGVTSFKGAGKASAAGVKILNNAKKYVGIMYKWGGTGNGGYDCSGFTQRVAKDSGVSIPRTAEAQRKYFVTKGWTVSYKNAMPGDIIIFKSNGPSGRHAAVYLGNGLMVEAPGTGRRIGASKVSRMGNTILAVGRIPVKVDAQANAAAQASARQTLK